MLASVHSPPANTPRQARRIVRPAKLRSSSRPEGPYRDERVCPLLRTEELLFPSRQIPGMPVPDRFPVFGKNPLPTVLPPPSTAPKPRAAAPNTLDSND